MEMELVFTPWTSNGTEVWHWSWQSKPEPASERSRVSYRGRGFHAVWQEGSSQPFSLCPAVWEEHVYVGCLDGYVYALDTYNGLKKWEFRT